MTANEPVLAEELLTEEVMVAMRDGTRLRTQVIRPVAVGRYPVLLKRHCYWSYATAAGSQETHRQLAKRGYAVVLQYSRGTMGSEGDFRPIVIEGEDGYDAVEWAAEQPWSNGRVATFGSSYLGMTQWQIAKRRPPHLVAMVSSTPGGDGFSNWPYHSKGVLAVHCAAPWTLLQSQQRAAELGVPHPVTALPSPFEANDATGPAVDVTGPFPTIVTDNWSESGQGDYATGGSALMQALNATLSRRPLRDAPEFEVTAPWWAEWMDNPDQTSDYWRGADLAGQYGDIAVPVLHNTGWYDLFLGSTIHDFQEMVRCAPSEDLRRSQRLLIGPFDHLGASNFAFGNVYDPAGPNVPGRLGEFRFFPDETVPFDQRAGVRFLAEHAHGLPGSSDDGAPIRIFVMGENVWRDEREWPLARTQWTDFFLDSAGDARTSNGDGVLVSRPRSDADSSYDVFDYDPQDPVPSTGGPILIGAMPADQRQIEARQDVLVYSTEALPSDVEVTGPVKLELWISSSAIDTDFTATLVDVHPDGRAINLCGGMVRTRFSAEDDLLLEPDRAYPFTIDLVATSNVFRKGHRIRLDISSSSYPLYDVNPNTGRHSFNETELEFRVATQKVHHGGSCASRLILPVIPRPSSEASPEPA